MTKLPSWLCFQYTLTETHVGGSGTVGATDLPIAREATTGFPFLPDTALKGVARDVAEDLFGKDSDPVKGLFGSIAKRTPGASAATPEADASGDAPSPGAGALAFTQGHLLLYPLRSLERPFVYATCALQLSRLPRLLRAFNLKVPSEGDWSSLRRDAPLARVTTTSGLSKHLVVESLAYGADALKSDPSVDLFAEVLKQWFGGDGSRRELAQDLPSSLVVLPDADFAALVRSSPPIRARVSLNDRKTTTGDGGNLWYEEMLPSECLFWSILSLQRTLRGAGADEANRLLEQLKYVQVGAGETTGHGRCWWWPAPEVE